MSSAACQDCPTKATSAGTRHTKNKKTPQVYGRNKQTVFMITINIVLNHLYLFNK